MELLAELTGSASARPPEDDALSGAANTSAPAGHRPTKGPGRTEPPPSTSDRFTFNRTASISLANRSDGTVDFQGKKVHGAGENTVAVFSLDVASGEPTLIQIIGVQSYHARTFSIQSNRKMLVTDVAPLAERDGDQVRNVPEGCRC